MELLTEIMKELPALGEMLTKQEQLELMDCPFERVHTDYFHHAEGLCRDLLKKNSRLKRLFRQAGVLQERDMVQVLIQALNFHLKTCFGNEYGVTPSVSP